MTLYAKMAMSDSQRYLKSLVWSSMNYISMFSFLKTVYFHLRFLSEINTFQVGKTTVSSTFFIRLRFQGYPCKSGIVIFAWGGGSGPLEFTLTDPLRTIKQLFSLYGVFGKTLLNFCVGELESWKNTWTRKKPFQ